MTEATLGAQHKTARAASDTSTHGRRRMLVYCRISDDREGRQYGVERQERQCRDLAKRNGDEIVEVFVDDDRSAYSGKPRPDYLRMLELLRTGTVDGVYALAPTRLYRRLDDGLEFLKLIQQRALAVETVKAGRYNLATADGRRDALRAAVDAQHEAEQISERVRDAKADNVARGEYRGGPRPFGYEPDGVTPRTLACPQCGNRGARFDIDRVCIECGAVAVNEPGSEAAWAAWACEAIIGGDSLRSVCARLAAAGVTTAGRRHKQPDGTRGEVTPKPWGMTDLRRMLLRPRNAGLIDHDGEIVGRAQWAPIVAEETWRACREILLNPKRRTSPGNSRVWLLAGIARCGTCGAPVKCTTTGSGRKPATAGKSWAPAYVCTAASKHVTRRAVNLDGYIRDLVLERLSRADAAELLAPEPEHETGPQLATEANALRIKLDSIADDYAHDLITRKQMLDMTAATRARLDQVDAEMAARASKSVLAAIPLGTPEIADEWDGYHLDRKRAIISALMTITVHKARRGRPQGFKAGQGETYFDPETIEIQWLAGA